MNAHPSSCPLVFHVGVTGHRELSASTVPAIRHSVAAVLATIDETLCGIAEAEAKMVPAASVLRLISSLANGADQIAASAALERGWELQCPLPFAREEYEKDFAQPAGVAEFRALLERATSVFEHDGDRRHKGAAYLEAGRTMLAQSDLVIALWDGEPSRGVGGTADIVREALAKGLPVVRIDPARPETPILLGAAPNGGDWTAGVRAHLRELLELPEKSRGRLQRYLSETERLFNWGWMYFLFRNRFGGGKWSGNGAWRSGYAAVTAGWEAEWKTEPSLQAAVGDRIDGCLHEHCAWTNGLAETYAGLFRSAFILRYFLVTVSVLFGAVGFYGPKEWGWMGFVAQVLCLLAAVGLIQCDNKNRWQRKAVEYRWIAEQLRIHRYLLPLGRTVLPVAQAGHPIYEGPRWGRRHLRCIIRQVGLISGRVDSAFLRAHRAFVLKHEIEEQRGYHQTTAGRNSRIARRLYLWAMWLFLFGLVAIELRMGLYCGFPEDAGSMRDYWVLSIKVTSAVLPALGVMFSSLRAHGEFARLGARSNAMAGYLAVRVAALRSNEAPTWTDAVDDTTRLALILRAEVADWNTVMESRGLALPV